VKGINNMRKTGTYKTIGRISYFIPKSLPPKEPPLSLSAQMIDLHGEASFALGQLNEMSRRLPGFNRFIRAYLIKEALLSSAIEGIHTTLLDVYTYPREKLKQTKDTQLVLNYINAVNDALRLMKEQNLPLVSRVLLCAHRRLLSKGESDKATPGAYRKQSVRVGDLVPPAAPDIPALMTKLEKYTNTTSSKLPILVRTGLVHVQFETIHPFLDGNGRIGRLLIVLMLIDNGLLNLPILYPSYYFKKHRLEYYQRLNQVRTQGDFEGWIKYYLQAIKYSAVDAYTRAKEIESLEKHTKQAIQDNTIFTKMKKTALIALNYLFMNPVTTITEMSHHLNKSYNAINNILDHFASLGIVTEKIIHKRNKLYQFDPYLNLLEKDYPLK
jgi:Fic family protein